MYHCNLKPIGACTVLILLLCLSACTKAPISLLDNDLIVNVSEEAKLDESINAELPHIYITIEDEKEVTSKDIYLNANISIEDTNNETDLNIISTRIKGRGNSTWIMPKKPYRLKLDKSTSLLGLPAAKDWVLLANYMDYTLMTNAVAMKIGKQLAMPYTHDILPVDLTINGVYRGNYNLTQQVEIHENRVNVGSNGILWELDSYFDEDWKFKTTKYNLPVMLKDPKVESVDDFLTWQSEFNQFVNLVGDLNFPNNKYGEAFDKKQLVNYVLVNMLVGNQEICHPKSVFIHKKDGGKYAMGPLWDFDYSFGFSEEHSKSYFNYVDLPLFGSNDKRIGSVFFKRLLMDPEIQTLFKKTWITYKSKHFNELMSFIEVFAATIRDSQKRDYQKWKVGNNKHAENKASLKVFLRKRTAIVDAFVKGLK